MATAASPTTITASHMDFSDLLSEHLRAGYQIMYVPTTEESRVEKEIKAVADRLKYKVVVWDLFEGFSDGPWADKPEYRNPVVALRLLADETKAITQTLFVFRDLDDFWANPEVRRAIRTLCEGNRLVNTKRKRPLIITSPQLEIHQKLRSCMTTIDFNLPDEAKLSSVFAYVQASVAAISRDRAMCSDELRDQIIAGLRGLTATEAENCLSRCLVRHTGFGPNMLATIKDEKAAIIKKSEVLTYVDETTIASREQLGGYDNLMEFIDRKKLAYSKAAREQNIDYPKGIVLLGVPGSGKSVVAQTIGRVLSLPVITFDVSAIFGSLVGQSEARMRDALRQITAFNGCVLVLDEADKAFGGAHESQGDSGVTRRTFGQLLTWLAAKQDRTFVVMTMNRTTGVPPEFLRSGRFDAVFFTDVPTPTACEEIFKIHLKKRGVDLAGLAIKAADWKVLAEKAAEFVGSELEEAVKEARSIAFETRGSGNPTFEDMLQGISAIIPLARLDATGLEEIRKYCKDRARPVAKMDKVSKTRLRNVDLSPPGAASNN